MRSPQNALIIIAVMGIAAFLFSATRPSAPVDPQATAEFGGATLQIEYAKTPAERELGLGGRNDVPEGYGMLFVFPKDDRYGFWMKDTRVPLDIFWLDAQGHVVSIAANVATTTFPDVFYPSKPARYVLETAAGFSRTFRIDVGMPLLLKNFPIVSE